MPRKLIETNSSHTIIFYLFLKSDVIGEYLSPCGACRQFIAEFGLDWNVILVRDNDDYKVYSVREMLPFAFDSKNLDMERIEH